MIFDDRHVGRGAADIDGKLRRDRFEAIALRA
jgi:hypothetical protein